MMKYKIKQVDNKIKYFLNKEYLIWNSYSIPNYKNIIRYKNWIKIGIKLSIRYGK